VIQEYKIQYTCRFFNTQKVSVLREDSGFKRMKLEYSNMGVGGSFVIEEKTAEHYSYHLLILLTHFYYLLVYYLFINKAKCSKTESVLDSSYIRPFCCLKMIYLSSHLSVKKTYPFIFCIGWKGFLWQ